MATRKSIRVLSGTGSAGVQQVKILPNVTGPTGLFQQAVQLNGFTGPTGTFKNVQNANTLVAGMRQIIISGYVSPTGEVPAVLSLPVLTSTSVTTATATTTTDTGSGTLYVVVSTNSSTPTAAQIVAGLDAAGAAGTYASSATPSAGANNFSATGLAPLTTYYAFFAQVSGGGTSNVTASSSALITPVGLLGWWDTSVTASLSLTGSAINSITDQSGNSQTLSFVNAKPTYSATGFNTSFPALTTNGSSTALEKTSFPMGVGNTFTAWFVGTLATASQFGRALSYTSAGIDDGNNVGSWTLFRSNSNTVIGVARNSLSANSNSLTASPAGHRILLTINSSGVMTIYGDGVASSTTTSAGNWVTGGAFAIGRRGANGFDYGGYTIAEAGVATGFSDATAAAALDTRLKAKWGL